MKLLEGVDFKYSACRDISVTANRARVCRRISSSVVKLTPAIYFVTYQLRSEGESRVDGGRFELFVHMLIPCYLNTLLL